MSGFKDTDFITISARIKSREANLMGRGLFAKICKMKSTEEAVSFVCTHLGHDLDSLQNIIEKEYLKTVSFLRESSHTAPIIDILTLNRDFLNIKILIKSELRGISPEKFLCTGGILSVDAIQKAYTDKDKNIFDGYLLKAVTQSFETFEKTKDTKKTDIVCDKLYFEYIKLLSLKLLFIKDYFQIKIDILNIISLFRQKAMKKDDEIYFDNTIFKKSFKNISFPELYTLPVPEILKKIKNTKYANIYENVDETNFRLFEIEKYADIFLCEKIKQMRMALFGAKTVAGYFLAKEYELKNLKLAVSGISEKLNEDEIMERLRFGYE